MHEEILRDFLLGEADASSFSQDLNDSIVTKGPNEAGVRIVDLGDGDHTVTAEQLIKVCEAVEAGGLEPWKLEAIGFCLVASDYFQWDRAAPDGKLVGDVIGIWSAPQVNYPLTVKNVSKAKRLLATGENLFTPEDLKDVPDRAWNVDRVSKIFESTAE